MRKKTLDSHARDLYTIEHLLSVIPPKRLYPRLLARSLGNMPVPAVSDIFAIPGGCPVRKPGLYRLNCKHYEGCHDT